MRRLSALTRRVHTAPASAALPALAEAARPSMLGSLFGGSSAPSLPPMTEALAGVVHPPYSPPATAPSTQQKKLANGALLAAEETSVR